MLDVIEKNMFELILKVIERAEAMGIGFGDRITQMLDIENAHKQFNMDFEDWLAADDLNFAHDFLEIQANMNRITGKCENFFVPRFAYADKRHAVEVDK